MWMVAQDMYVYTYTCLYICTYTRVSSPWANKTVLSQQFLKFFFPGENLPVNWPGSNPGLELECSVP